jgi:hypothetical protein
MGAELLQQAVILLNNTAAQGSASPLAPFAPEHYQVHINQLWFLSMLITLSAVIIGTLCFQWLSAYRRADAKYTSSPDALALRQVRYEGLMGWGVPYIPAFLIMAVQAAVILFIIGLLMLLWHVNKQAALPVLIVGGCAGLIVVLLVLPVVLPTLLPFLPRSARRIPQCPFKTPWSWAIHRLFIFPFLLCSYIWVFLRCLIYMCCKPSRFLSIPGSPKFPVRVFNRHFDFFLSWHQLQINLLKGFDWEQYDKIWHQLWEGTSSKATSRSYYLFHGLTSVLETLGSQPSASHIVNTCLQLFKGDSMEYFERYQLAELFTARFTTLEGILLEGFQADNGQNSNKTYDVLALRRDLLNAHILEYLLAPNLALHRNFLSLHVELYIRIRNNEFSWNRKELVKEIIQLDQQPQIFPQSYYDDQIEELAKGMTFIGQSLTCPIVTQQDTKFLPLGKSCWPCIVQNLIPHSALRLQFLLCMEPLIGTGRFQAHDAYATILILSEEKFNTLPVNKKGENDSNDEIFAEQSCSLASEESDNI